MTNSSLFDVIEFEDRNDQGKVRQAMALSIQRVEDRFATFIRQGSVDDQAARYSLVEDDIKAVVAAACQQVGFADTDSVYKTISNNFVTGDATPQLRTASVRHEARKPKMCPYHSEVTDISLAAGDPSAGYNAMASHAWTNQHCQGGEYEGDRCKFKPAMTTQAFWDEKAEKAEQRRQERAEQAEQVQQEQPVLELQTVDFEDEATQEDFIDDLAETDSLDSPEPSAIGEGVEEVPMSMAAKTADTATVNPGFKIDKRKWTPKTVPHDQPLKADDADGRNPTRRKDVVEPITQTPDSPDNKGELKEIGEQVTEHQDVEKKWDGLSTSDQGGSFGGGDRSAVSSLLDPDRVREAMAKFKR
jgi:hypothetical protein